MSINLVEPVWRGAVFLVLSLGCLGLGSCTADTPQGQVLVFKHGKLAGDPTLIRALLDDFEQHHPGVAVREEVLPSSTDQQHQYYAINMESPRVPFDLLALDVIWVQEFARAGWIRSVEGVLPPDERARYFPSAIRAATFDDRLYAVPWYLDVGLLFYRRDLLERYGFEPPRTWSELVQMARTIQQGEGDPTLTGFLWTGKQSEGLVCVALEFIWGAGGSLFDSTGRHAERALGFLRALIEREGVTSPIVALADEETVRLLFGNGRAIFMRNWPYAWSLLQDGRSPVRGKIGIGSLPAFEDHQSASVLGGWMLAVPARAAHPEAALELLRYLTSSEVQRRMAQSSGYHPARHDLYHDPVLLETQAELASLYPVFLQARPRPITPYYLMLSQVWQPELSAVIVGRKTAHAALASGRMQSERILAIEGTTDDTSRIDREPAFSK